MEILPSLNFLAFMAHLIELRQFNSILVLHDQSTRNSINLLIGTLPERYDVAWLLINEYDDNPNRWNHSIILNENLLILMPMFNY